MDGTRYGRSRFHLICFSLGQVWKIQISTPYLKSRNSHGNYYVQTAGRFPWFLATNSKSFNPRLRVSGLKVHVAWMRPVSRVRPALSSWNETMPVMAPCITPPALSPRPLLFRQQRAFGPCSWSRRLHLLAFISSKSHCLVYKSCEAGEQGQIYRKWSPKESRPVSLGWCQIFIRLALNYRLVIRWFVVSLDTVVTFAVNKLAALEMNLIRVSRDLRGLFI